MPSTRTEVVRGTIGRYVSKIVRGGRVFTEGAYIENNDAMEFNVLTGRTGTPSAASVADITYNQAANVTLIAANGVTAGGCPHGTRPYVTGITLSVNGATAWTTGTSVNIQDTAGNIIAGFPLSSLGAYAQYAFPSPNLVTPLSVTVTGSSSTTTVVNVASTPFVAKATNSLVGAYVTGISGTAANIGFTRQITDHNTTSFTVGTAWNAVPAASDVFYVWSHQGVATMNATTVTANDSLTTSTMVGKSVQLLTGTGLGQARYVTANTNSAMTVGTLATAGDTTTTFSINSNADMGGAFDFQNTIGLLPCTAVNAGIVVALVGTFGAGSPIRVGIEGFFAA